MARDRKEYNRRRRMGLLPGQADCKVEGCGSKNYALGYCYRHYRRLLRYGDPVDGGFHPCAVEGCKRKTLRVYCWFHKKRLVHGLPMDNEKHPAKGVRNAMWKGGVALYPDHYAMKRNRIIKIRQCGGRCEVCGKKGYQIHHRDGSKDNHRLDNLVLLCRGCHGITHRGRRNKTSKFIRLYGMSLSEMAVAYGGYEQRYYLWHKKGVLAEKLNQLRKEEAK